MFQFEATTISIRSFLPIWLDRIDSLTEVKKQFSDEDVASLHFDDFNRNHWFIGEISGLKKKDVKTDLHLDIYRLIFDFEQKKSFSFQRLTNVPGDILWMRIIQWMNECLIEDEHNIFFQRRRRIFSIDRMIWKPRQLIKRYNDQYSWDRLGMEWKSTLD